MYTAEAVIADLARDQKGIVTRSQALGAGVSRHAIDLRLSDNRLRSLFDGVYLHGAVPLTWSARVLAAVFAAGDDAFASHRSAGRLHTYRDIPAGLPEVTVAATDLPRRSGVIIHRTDLLTAADITVVDGVPVTSRARTLLDLGAVVPYEVVEVAMQDALIRKLVDLAELVAVLERVGGRGRRGTASLRAALRGALPPEGIESELERRLVALFPPNHGFVLQHRLVCDDGREVRLDAARPDLRIAVEANGHRWHGVAKDLRRDMERRRSITASGWQHYEYGWTDVVETPLRVRAEIAALLRLAA